MDFIHHRTFSRISSKNRYGSENYSRWIRMVSDKLTLDMCFYMCWFCLLARTNRKMELEINITSCWRFYAITDDNHYCHLVSIMNIMHFYSKSSALVWNLDFWTRMNWQMISIGGQFVWCHGLTAVNFADMKSLATCAGSASYPCWSTSQLK